MSEKVLLPREVAEDIERLRKKGCSNFTIVRLAFEAYSDYSTIRKWAFDINGRGTPDLLMKALVNGYEIEETPEEKLRQYYSDVYEQYNELFKSDSRLYGVLEGIENTLDILGIEIPGINVEKDGD
ncbi:DUF1642 domain-containing protein [Aeribacillus composti]|uniref:DUF1642 domain-containing protein n=1 Tax=Aeribacillus composti TaxID=1868734 RepID=UPI00406A2297